MSTAYIKGAEDALYALNAMPKPPPSWSRAHKVTLPSVVEKKMTKDLPPIEELNCEEPK